MRPPLAVPPKLQPGDRVAVVSPSFAAPAAFPLIHEQAMTRLADELGLVPVEYPTTAKLDASPSERAADLMTAFADPAIRAVLATIGGGDQITVLPYLDPAILRADPKPFFGYSDNTNLLNYLWHLGIAGYHGGSTMVHLGRGGRTHPISIESLRSALFTREDREIVAPVTFSEHPTDWNSPDALTTEPEATPAAPFTWHRPNRVVTAPTWGGNLEILHWNLAADRWIHPVEEYHGCILLIETSEEMPAPQEVFRMLRNAGERGLLAQFPAVLVGRALASDIADVRTVEQRRTYREEQRAAVVRAFAHYNPDAMIVFDVDFGHTDPQWVLPYGGTMTVDGPARRIIAHY